MFRILNVTSSKSQLSPYVDRKLYLLVYIFVYFLSISRARQSVRFVFKSSFLLFWMEMFKFKRFSVHNLNACVSRGKISH